MTPQVDVLLATCNGAAYLHEQIDSVLGQTSVEIRILARDDASQDGTLAILRGYAAKHPTRFQVLEDGATTGSAKGNFARLLAVSTAPLVAFCDQDDVWLPHKLRDSVVAMRQLEARYGVAKPLLVYTDLRVVDSSLHTVADSLWVQNGLASAAKPTFAKLLRENTVTGCTSLLNRPLAELMLPMPDAAQMHDHWAALIAASMGALTAIPQATVLYRQHGRNTLGAMQGGRPAAEKLHLLFGREGTANRAKQYALDRAQAEALLHLHGRAMPVLKLKTVEAFVSLGSLSRFPKIATVLRHRLWRDGFQRNAAMSVDLLR